MRGNRARERGQHRPGQGALDFDLELSQLDPARIEREKGIVVTKIRNEGKHDERVEIALVD